LGHVIIYRYLSYVMSYREDASLLLLIYSLLLVYYITY
jgi:hypothetical protein